MEKFDKDTLFSSADEVVNHTINPIYKVLLNAAKEAEQKQQGLARAREIAVSNKICGDEFLRAYEAAVEQIIDVRQRIHGLQQDAVQLEAAFRQAQNAGITFWYSAKEENKHKKLISKWERYKERCLSPQWKTCELWSECILVPSAKLLRESADGWESPESAGILNKNRFAVHKSRLTFLQWFRPESRRCKTEVPAR